MEATDRSGSHKLRNLRLSSFVVCLWSQKGNFDVSPNGQGLSLCFEYLGYPRRSSAPLWGTSCVILIFLIDLLSCNTPIFMVVIDLSNGLFTSFWLFGLYKTGEKAYSNRESKYAVLLRSSGDA